MESNNITVSVSVITYGHEKYIRQALESILMQKTNFKFEIVVGEDASPDKTRDILLEYKEKFPSIFKLILQEKNVGPARNSYLVRQNCIGKYVAGLEGDDYWVDPYKLQKQVDLLEGNEKWVGVASNHLNVDNDGENTHIALRKKEVNREYTFKNYLNEGYTFHVNSLLHRNILPTSGERYDKVRFAGTTMGDIIKYCMLLDKGNIYVIEDITLAHRSPSANDSAAFSFRQKNEVIKYSYMQIKIVDALEEYFNQNYDLSPIIANRTAETLMLYFFRLSNINKKELRQYMKVLPPKTRNSSYIRFFKLIIRKSKRKVGKMLKSRMNRFSDNYIKISNH